MNCGLGNLQTLKKHLTPTLMNDVRFDEIITDIGRGVAGLFDAHCNREFTYFENYTEIFLGNRANWYVKRYPLLSIAKVELRYFVTDNWNDITSQPLIDNAETGLFNFGYTLGPAPLQVRVTYTGGYWHQTLEPSDAAYQVCNVASDPGYPGALPQAIQNSPNLNPPGIEPFKFLLPREIRTAWLLQCRTVWDAIDKLGTGITDKPKEQTSVSELEFSPIVKAMLRPHRRMQIS